MSRVGELEKASEMYHYLSPKASYCNEPHFLLYPTVHSAPELVLVSLRNVST